MGRATRLHLSRGSEAVDHHSACARSTAQREVPLATYAGLQPPRAQEVGLCRKGLGGLSCREYEAACEPQLHGAL